jgi:2-oxoisovalerate dehydrogenase E2 component (dihydrolipoyl transacylase)
VRRRAQVPNIKAVQERSIVGIARELARLQAAAAAGRLGQADLAGGTLTVSNIGAIGGTYATPLVNVPEAAIVALGRRASRSHTRGNMAPQQC